MIRTKLILLPVFLMSVFLVSADASASCREGKFIAKPRADGSVLIDDECQPAAPSQRSTSVPRQVNKTPPQPATAETKPEAKAPIKTDILGFTIGMSEEEIKKRGARE